MQIQKQSTVLAERQSWLRFDFEECEKLFSAVEHHLQLLVLAQVRTELHQLRQDSFQLGQD